jgi:GTP-binding protein
MVDCEVGLHALDEDFAGIIREIDKPIYVIANKADTPERELNSSEFYSLGLDSEIIPISSASGSGTGDLLDKIVEHFEEEEEKEKEDLPKIAIIGRPNVGKSSFINALLGEERTIVTDIAGTTRDAINTRYNRFGKDFLLTDTAGIRKKSKVHEDIEFYSVLRAIQAIQDSDVSVVMLDANQGLESQDMNIIGLSHKYKKGTIIMVNKWDLIEKETQTAEEYRQFLKEKLGPLSYIPIIFTSVLTKQRIFQAIELALKVYEDKTTKISTSKLNDKLLKDIERYPPPAVRGHYIKIKYITQLPTTGVTFAFFTNFPQYIKEPYQRYLTNKIRDHFGFEGVPITVVFRKK